MGRGVGVCVCVRNEEEALGGVRMNGRRGDDEVEDKDMGEGGPRVME